MAINIGIVGLPNVGKSTLFNALSAAGAMAANFPFCTIEPNVGVVPVPDERLDILAKLYDCNQVVPTALEFVDIAGLVKGASKGEGLGNQFLGHIRSVDAIAHVVRCFENPDVVHVDGSVDPLRDVEVIETELLLKDLETLEKRIERGQKMTRAAGKAGDAARSEVVSCERFYKEMSSGKVPAQLQLTDDEKLLMQDLSLLTAKPIIYIANISESAIANPDSVASFHTLKEWAAKRGANVIPISAAIEAEVSELPLVERTPYLASLGLKEPGLHQVIREAYKLLELVTFITAGEKETRAWTVKKGAKAPQAAGVIHSDFEHGFIRAEVIRWQDLAELKSEAAVKTAGKLRVEGKEYVVQDGDVMHFRFNV
jgi:ribosome-binding ATPase